MEKSLEERYTLNSHFVDYIDENREYDNRKYYNFYDIFGRELGWTYALSVYHAAEKLGAIEVNNDRLPFTKLISYI